MKSRSRKKRLRVTAGPQARSVRSSIASQSSRAVSRNTSSTGSLPTSLSTSNPDSDCSANRRIARSQQLSRLRLSLALGLRYFLNIGHQLAFVPLFEQSIKELPPSFRLGLQNRFVDL